MPVPKVSNSELGAQGRNRVNKNTNPTGRKGSNPPRGSGRITPSSARQNATKK